MITYVTKNGAIFVPLESLPLIKPPEDMSSNEEAIKKMFPDAECSLCSKTDYIRKTRLKQISRIHHQIKKQVEIPITNIEFERYHYLCSSCIESINTTATELITQNSQYLVANNI